MAHEYTPRFKQRVRVVAAVATMASGAAPFVAGLVALHFAGESLGRYGAPVLAVVCFALGAVLPWFVQAGMALAGNMGLRQRVLQQILLAHPEAELAGATFAGFSPGEKLHVWHGETDRDVGFLSVEPGGLVYLGDEFHWSLPRSYVDHVDLTPPEGGMQRIVVRWHVPREVGRTFTLESREARNLREAHRDTLRLYRQLRDWSRSRRDEEAEVVPLGTPPTDMSGAQKVEEPASGSCLTVMACAVITLTGIWRVSGALLEYRLYYHAILWAGLIAVLGALATGYLLHYLQAWEAERGQRRG